MFKRGWYYTTNPGLGNHPEPNARYLGRCPTFEEGGWVVAEDGGKWSTTNHGSVVFWVDGDE